MGAKKTKNLESNKNKKNYTNIFQKIPQPYQSLDEKGYILDVNNEWLKTLGYKKNEVIGKSFELFLDSKDIKIFKKIFPIFKTKGEIHNIEFTLIKKNKEKINVYFDGKIEYDENAKFKRTHCIFFDITEKKKLEDSLRQSELQKKLVLNSTKELFAYYNTEFEILWANKAALDSIDKKLEDVLGTHCYELWAGLKKPCPDCPLLKVLKTGKPQETEKQTPDGRYWIIRGYPIYDENGKISNLCELTLDITKQKTAEEKLKNAEKILKLKLDSLLSPDVKLSKSDFSNIINSQEIQSLMDDFYKLTNIGIAVVDMNGNILVANGWQEICTKFHRIHPETKKKCIQSDIYLTKNVKPGEYIKYKCKNNLWDIATPIIVSGKRIGTLFFGQFFYEDEKIDYSFFEKQAERYGFDKKKYIDALQKVPRFNKETISNAMNFYSKLSTMISKLSYSNLKLAKTIEKKKLSEEELQKTQRKLQEINKNLEDIVNQRIKELSKSNIKLKKEIKERKDAEEKYRLLFESSPLLIGEFDDARRCVSINPALAKSLKVKPDDIIGKKIDILIKDDVLEERVKNAEKVLKENKIIRFEDSRKDKFFYNIYVPILHSDGKRSIQVIVQDITKRKKAEIQNLQNIKYLENVVNSASEIIIAFDLEKNVKLWNKTAEELTGYKKNQMLNKKVDNLEVFEKAIDLKENIILVCNGKNIVLKNIVLESKKGKKRIVNFTASPIMQTNKRGSNSCLFIGTDKTVDSEYHGQILKGLSYMVSDNSSKPSLELFKNLTSFEYKGLYITRGETDKQLLKNTDVLLLRKKSKNKKDTISNIDELIDKVNSFCRKQKNSIIFIDRIDYLLTNFSFEELIKKLYQINDIISETNSVLIMYFNPNIFEKKQIALLEDEFKVLPGYRIDDVDISNELYDVLDYISMRNENKMLVSFKDIGKKFSIVSKTTSKRIEKLEKKGLIYIKKDGRRKILHVSEKGKNLLNTRNKS